MKSSEIPVFCHRSLACLNLLLKDEGHWATETEADRPQSALQCFSEGGFSGSKTAGGGQGGGGLQEDN